MKFALRSCPICGFNTVEVMHTQHFILPTGSPLPASYDIVACLECGFVYADTPGAQSDYDSYYAQFSKYDDPAIATGGGDSGADFQRIADTADLIATHVTDRKNSVRVLDIGCARGGILEALRQRGFLHLFGMDPSPVCVQHLRHLKLVAIQGTLSSLDVLNDQPPFDVIILSHVLEHVVDIGKTMEALHPLLTASGLLYLEVPDAARYVDYPVVPFYYFDSEHINHFDQASLANLARRYCFRCIDISPRNIALEGGKIYPAVWAFLTPAKTASALVASHHLQAQIQAYISQSEQLANYPELEALAASQQPVALWGAGSFAQRLLNQSPLASCRIISVIDQDKNKQGHEFFGLPIQAPEHLVQTIPADAVVVIAAALHATEIEKKLRSLGIKNQILYPCQ